MRHEIDRDILLTKFLDNQIARFLVTGLINTIGTYLIYLLMLKFLNHSLSYTVAYVSGIVIAYILNSFYTFKVKFSFKKMLLYPIVYLIQYLVNLLILNILILKFSISAGLAPVIVIVVSIPLTFFLSKHILKK
jgi:putative flippase GtrA